MASTVLSPKSDPISTAVARHRSSIGITWNASQSARAAAERSRAALLLPASRLKSDQEFGTRELAGEPRRIGFHGACQYRPVWVSHITQHERRGIDYEGHRRGRPTVPPRSSATTRSGWASTGMGVGAGVVGRSERPGSLTKPAATRSSIVGSPSGSRGPSWATGWPSTVMMTRSPPPARRTTAAT